jgi:hypothetical protein
MTSRGSARCSAFHPLTPHSNSQNFDAAYAQARSFKYAQIAQRAEQKTQRSRQIQPVCRVGHNLYLLRNSRPIQSAEEVHGIAKVRGLSFGRCTPSEAEECRQRALECAQKALRATDPAIRLAFAELAEQGSRIAEYAEALERPPKPPARR